MLKTVRIGKVEDQDQWRRDDLRKMTGNERVNHVLLLQEIYGFNTTDKIKRVAHIRSLA